MGGATQHGGGYASMEGGGAGFASVRVGGAGFGSGSGGGLGVGGAGLDPGGEEWEGLVLQDTPIKRVGVAHSSLGRGFAATPETQGTTNKGSTQASHG